MWTQHNECVETSYSSTGRAHEVNDVNEIITSRDPFENGEQALVNSVEDLPPTPTLGLGLTESEARGKEPNDSTRETMS